MPMAVSIQIAKFKPRQSQWRANSPNLMLAKVTRYMVCGEMKHTQLTCPMKLEN